MRFLPVFRSLTLQHPGVPSCLLSCPGHARGSENTHQEGAIIPPVLAPKQQSKPSSNFRDEGGMLHAKRKNDCSIYKRDKIKHGKGPKENKKTFLFFLPPLIPSALKLQEEKKKEQKKKDPGSFCVISLSCFGFLAICPVDLFS